MDHLIPFALIALLLAMASGRWVVRRSLGLLTTEQKARVLEVSATGNIWHLFCLVLGVALFAWVLPGRIPLPYLYGFGAVFLLTLVLISAGAAAGSVLRLSHAGLPQGYVRSVAWRTILFIVALLVLLAAFVYDSVAFARRRGQSAQSSNQAMERTADRGARHF